MFKVFTCFSLTAYNTGSGATEFASRQAYDPEEDCGPTGYVAAAVTFIIVYGGALLYFSFLALWRHRSRLDSPQVRACFGFLYCRSRPTTPLSKTCIRLYSQSHGMLQFQTCDLLLGVLLAAAPVAA